MRSPIRILFLSVLAVWWVHSDAQTTQSLISGRIMDSITGLPVGGAEVRYVNETVQIEGSGRADQSGRYELPLLSPGEYRLRVNAVSYQPQELQSLRLPVAARLDVSFRLRPLSDVWEAGQYRSVLTPNSDTVLTFYGPDVDTSRVETVVAAPRTPRELQPTVSYVIAPRDIEKIPLTGRDVYTMLLALPGATTYVATGRGLGLSVNGQRPTSSNFLLDGFNNNNDLVSGPQSPIAPEAVQEYRISTSNFSAEYGRTSGFLANVVSRAGTRDWRMLGYYYFKNEVLNANGFQQNRRGAPRAPVKEAQPGFVATGPIIRERLFSSLAFEYLRFRSRNEPTAYLLPTADFIAAADPATNAGRLLREFPAVVTPAGPGDFDNVQVSSPVSINRFFALPRLDYVSANGAHRLMARAALSALRQPDLLFTPYTQFNSAFRQAGNNIGLNWTALLTPSITSEAHLAHSADDLRLDRPRPDIPALFSSDQVLLPGSPSFYAYRNAGRNWDFGESLMFSHGPHLLKFGGGVLKRHMQAQFSAGRDGLLVFDDLQSFLHDTPRILLQSFDRLGAPDLVKPSFERFYRYSQTYLFVQDSYRATDRLSLSLGVRFERFGAPVNTGLVKDALIAFGPGTSLPERIAAASFVAAAGDQFLYDAPKPIWAGRFGVSYDLTGRGRTLLRGGYGLFYDRLFDNLWQGASANRLRFGTSTFRGPVNFLLPPAELARVAPPEFDELLQPVAFQPGLRSPLVLSYFTGIQQQLADGLLLELNMLGSSGRGLLTTDRINRAFSTASVPLQNNLGRFNASLPEIAYRANQGSSSYHALTAAVRYRLPRLQGQLAYTWSHNIDNQSDPLAGEFLDFNYFRGQSAENRIIASFTRQFDSGVDRGNSDFDQRHNLVFFTHYDMPPLFAKSVIAPLLRRWTIAGLGAIRSGFPYSVYGTAPFRFGVTELRNNRANLLSPSAAHLQTPVPGGQRLLNATAFSAPANGEVGSAGRNAFAGPGVYSVDLSLARRFGLPRMQEKRVITLRGDFYNLLNHANLNSPAVTSIRSPQFGIASYGRSERNTGFPLLTPLSESARAVQLMLRFEF